MKKKIEEKDKRREGGTLDGTAVCSRRDGETCLKAARVKYSAERTRGEYEAERAECTRADMYK